MRTKGFRNTFLVLITLAFIIVIFDLFLLVRLNTASKVSCDSLDLEEDQKTKIATIICIKGLNKSKIVEITDMNFGHYHGYEIRNGNLYLIRRTGNATYPSETWTDELWRYDTNLKSRKLYSVKGLDFRVSPDEKIIAIVTNDYFNILNSNGDVVKSFTSNEVIANASASPMFSFHAWGLNSIWLDNTFGPSLAGLARIDMKTFAVIKYDLSALIAGPEFQVNVYKGSVAFSNYPALFDEDTADIYKKSGSVVKLVIYNLDDKTQKTLATSVTKAFKPVWIDENTLEFDDPKGIDRKTIKVY